MEKKRKVVGARADSDGDISHVLLDGNQRYTPVSQAIPMADRGEIEDVHVVRPRDKKPHLRTNPNSTTCDNLDDMAGDS